ncbi:MAG: hypothetical protein ACO3L1_03605 [Flavobacteriaceae bacterium]
MRSIFALLFSDSLLRKLERLTLFTSIGGFLVHLTLIGLNNLGLIGGLDPALFSNPISAIYTPFSFILIYEIYVLIYFLPRSFTTSLLKQFEIIALILIRRIFGDIAMIDFEGVEIEDQEVTRLFIDLFSVLILLAIILFYTRIDARLSKIRSIVNDEVFRVYKKNLAVILVFVITGISLIHLADFISVTAYGVHLFPGMENDLNAIFYKDFFTVLILSDVLILLLSYGLTKENFKLLRNTGFVISTVLIRISFSTQGVFNSIFIITGALFGLAILKIYFEFTKSAIKQD